jgi:hypothetical protein
MPPKRANYKLVRELENKNESDKNSFYRSEKLISDQTKEKYFLIVLVLVLLFHDDSINFRAAWDGCS